MIPIVEHFDILTRHQILAIRPGVWSDTQLLDALEHFESKQDRDRAMAVAELILHSPQVDDVDYDLLYVNLVGYYCWRGDFEAALHWAHASVTFDEQHHAGRNRASHCRDLAETYLSAGDLDAGLALFARLAQAQPADIWNYNALGFALPRSGLPRLALEVLDCALTLVSQDDPEQLTQQLTVQRCRTAESLAAIPDRSDDLSPVVLAEFRAAFLGAVSSSPRRARDARHKEVTPYLPPVAQLLTASLPDAVCEAESLCQAQGKVLAPELIRLAFDPDVPVTGASLADAPARAIALLRAMRDMRTAELGELSPWLDHADGDWRNDSLAVRCGKVGGYTTSELEAIAADTRYSVYVRDSALASLVERVKRQPAQHERLVAFMRTLLTRPEADTANEETFIGFLIGNALDWDACELYPDIQRAFTEGRVDTAIVSELEVHDRWGTGRWTPPKRRQDGLYLRLRCTACGRVREHFVQNILLDLATLGREAQGQVVTYDPYIMDREIVCPRCGAVDRYAMTSEAHLTLVASSSSLEDITAVLAGEKSAADLPPNPRVHTFQSQVFGQPMHPLAGLDEYRRRIAANPGDARLYLKMGNLLRILYRYPAALEAHRQAYRLNPNDAEIALACAMSEHDFGDRAVAKEIYTRVIELESKGVWGIFRAGKWTSTAMEGLDLLKQRKPSPCEAPFHASNAGFELEAKAKKVTSRSRKRRRRK